MRRSVLIISLCVGVRFGDAHAAPLSGEVQLEAQDILVSGKAPHKGSFDLTSLLPMGEEFTLTNVRISFHFQDDAEWRLQEQERHLEETGRIETRDAPAGSLYKISGHLLPRKISGQTYHYVNAISTEKLSNPEEVAKLTIGRNIYFGATDRRQEVLRDSLGTSKTMLGVFAEAQNETRLRQHFRITEEVRERRRDGYDGVFSIENKALDVTSAQDLAHSGRLDFELSGKGDYIFLGATLWYEGQVIVAGPLEDAEKPALSLIRKASLLCLVAASLMLASLIWRQRDRAVKKQRHAHKARESWLKRKTQIST